MPTAITPYLWYSPPGVAPTTQDSDHVQVGGATARVGDPTGRLVSRQSMQSDVHKNNLVSIYTQVKHLWANAVKCMSRGGQARQELGDGKTPRRQVLNNAVWMDKLNLVDFLKYVGTGARMGTMLGRDT